MSKRVVRHAGMSAVLAVVVFFSATQVLEAAWIPFIVTSTHPGQSAIGWEQIFIVGGTGPGGNGLPIGTAGFDYAYLIANTGALPINGFFFDVGVPNNAAAVSAFAFASAIAGTFTATAFGGADLGLFPAVAPGGARPTPNINGELGPVNPFVFGSAPIFPVNGPGVNPLPPLQGILQEWGFEQFRNNPFTAYIARYYGNTPTDLLVPPFLPPGFITRFDVYSPFGPVPGGGGVDPLDAGNFLGIDDGSGLMSDLVTSHP